MNNAFIYSPAEDSFLLKAEIKKYSKNKDVLDLGSGSGILAFESVNAGAKSVLAADINKGSVKFLKEQGIKAIYSDLFSNINKKFDLIIFNPPYLPLNKKEDKISRLSTTGGENGDELILRFLKESPEHLNNKGIILLLVSSLTPLGRIRNLIKKIGMKYKKIAERNLFFEKLEVLKIVKTKVIITQDIKN